MTPGWNPVYQRFCCKIDIVCDLDKIIMSPWALWLCTILLIGAGVAADVPFVFDETSSGVASYNSDQIEQAHLSSPDLAGVPPVTRVEDNDVLDFPITGGGNAPVGTIEKNVSDLKKRLDAAVEPDNPRVREEALVLALMYPGDLTVDQVCSIYSYLKNGDGSKDGWGYVRDPRGLDYFNYANASLKAGDRAKCVGGGDCDDFAILMSALVESVGGTTRIILARNSTTGGHAYTEVYLGNLDAQNSQVEDIINWLKQEFNTNKIYTHIDTDTKETWLNLDWGPDESGNTHPGGPFYLGDKHIVLCIRGTLVKTALKLPEKSNKPPKLISLTSDKSSLQNAGAVVTWTAEARDPESDEMLYRFFLNNEPETKWTGENEWTWTTTDYDIGENQIEVRVRDGKHTGPDGFDSNKVATFTVNAPETKPTETRTITNPGTANPDSGIVGKWECTFEQYLSSYGPSQTYPMIMEITTLKGNKFSGTIYWPTLRNSVTTCEGNIEEDTLQWTELRLIQGSNILLNGIYKAKFEDKNTLVGKYYLPKGPEDGAECGKFELKRVADSTDV